MASPIIWRELVDTGGRVTLIGDARDFQEYANIYYAQVSKLCSHKLLQITTDNQHYMDEITSTKAIKQVTRNTWRKITIIGAESPTAARLSMLLSMMQHADKARKMKLHLFPGKSNDFGVVEDLKNTLDESVCTGLHLIEASVNLTEALEDASLVIILDVVPRNPHILAEGVLVQSESRAEWLGRRFHYFYRLGKSIRRYADQNVRIIVSGSEGKNSSPLNFDVQTLHMACKENIALNSIVGLPRSLEYSMKAALARNLGVYCSDIVDLILWGNIDNAFFVDVSQARVYRRRGRVDSESGPAWFNLSAEPLLFDSKEVYGKIIPEKFEEIVSSSGMNVAAMCHASAIFSFIKQWYFGFKDPNETITSLVVSSPGEYDNILRFVQLPLTIQSNTYISYLY